MADQSHNPHDQSSGGAKPSPDLNDQSQPDQRLDALTQLVAILDEEISDELASKNSTEQRAITVITTSATLATLVFTIVTAITKFHGAENLFKEERIPIQIGVVAFLAAAVVGLVVNVPRRYLQINAKSYPEFWRWAGSSEDPKALVAEEMFSRRVEELARAQRLNFQKAELLLLAFIFEVVALGFITVALFVILSRVT